MNEESKFPVRIYAIEGFNNSYIISGYWHSIPGTQIKTETYINKDILYLQLSKLKTKKLSDKELFLLNYILDLINKL